jgi:hypothetical protein
VGRCAAAAAAVAGVGAPRGPVGEREEGIGTDDAERVEAGGEGGVLAVVVDFCGEVEGFVSTFYVVDGVWVTS